MSKEQKKEQGAAGSITAGCKTKPVAQFKKGVAFRKIANGGSSENTWSARVYKKGGQPAEKRYYCRTSVFKPVASKEIVLRNAEIVLASKFAILLDKRFFASEHLLDNGHAVSRSLPPAAYEYCRDAVFMAEFLKTLKGSKAGYHQIISAQEAYRVAASMRKDNYLLNKLRKEFPSDEEILSPEQDKALDAFLACMRWKKSLLAQGHITGLGLIDEACYFIGESDNNSWNLMMLGEGVSSHLIKIDYDRCFIGKDSSVFDRRYVPKEDFASIKATAIYGRSIISEEPEKYLPYLKERAFARESYGKLPDAVIEALVRKHIPPIFEERIVALIDVIKAKRDRAKASAVLLKEELTEPTAVAALGT
jgi:hypothetical protein